MLGNWKPKSSILPLTKST